MKWVIIQTSLAMCPEEPDITLCETTDSEARFEEIREKLDEVERNDMNITAVPLAKLLVGIGHVEPDEVATIE